MKKIFLIFLTALLLVPSAWAADADSPTQERYTHSPWSAETMLQSEQLGFLTTDVYSGTDLRIPATRDEFRKAAVRFLIVQEQQDKLEDLAEYYLAERTSRGR